MQIVFRKIATKPLKWSPIRHEDWKKMRRADGLVFFFDYFDSSSIIPGDPYLTSRDTLYVHDKHNLKEGNLAIVVCILGKLSDW